MSRPDGVAAGSLGRPLTVASGLLRDWPLPGGQGNKDAQGRVLIVGGNTGTPGAILLAAEAAMRAGAGKLQITTVDTVAVHLAVAIPEGYVEGLPADADGDLSIDGANRIVELASSCDAVVIGPGFMTPEGAGRLMEGVVPRLDTAVCIDALGLAYLTGNLTAVRHLAGRVVLSPNLTELYRTLEREQDDDDEGVVRTIADLASATGAVVVSGGENTFVVTPDEEAWSDRAGGQGMAVSGSGDVKAGIVAGLLARGADATQAAVWASHVHGRCGERLGVPVRAPRLPGPRHAGCDPPGADRAGTVSRPYGRPGYSEDAVS